MQPVPAANVPARGAALIVVAMAMMGLVDNFVVVVAETTGIWQFQVIRSTISLSLLALVARGLGWRLRPLRWRPVLARSAILSTALVIYFAALALLPIAEAVAGLFTAPIFILLLSACVYGERIGPLRVGAVLSGFAGVLLVLRPETGGVGPMNLLPVVAGAFYALAMVATRQWCTGETAQTLTFGFFAGMGIWGVIGLIALTLWPQPVPAGADGWVVRQWGDMASRAWLWTLAQAVVSLVAVALITRAYQLGDASFLAVFEYALLVFAVFWAAVLMAQAVDVVTAAGLGLILVSGALIAAPRRTPVTD